VDLDRIEDEAQRIAVTDIHAGLLSVQVLDHEREEREPHGESVLESMPRI
jgi:hypothetical protein